MKVLKECKAKVTAQAVWNWIEILFRLPQIRQIYIITISRKETFPQIEAVQKGKVNFLYLKLKDKFFAPPQPHP